MRDLKKSKNLEYRKSRNRDEVCECVKNTEPTKKKISQINELEMSTITEKSYYKAGETAFLNRVVKEQVRVITMLTTTIVMQSDTF